MIKLNRTFTEEKADKKITGELHMKITHWHTYELLRTYEVEDYIIDAKGEKNVIRKTTFSVSNDQINELSNYIQVPPGLTSVQEDWFRAKIGLYIFVTTVDFLKDDDGELTEFVIHYTLPSEWELC